MLKPDEKPVLTPARLSARDLTLTNMENVSSGLAFDSITSVPAETPPIPRLPVGGETESAGMKSVFDVQGMVGIGLSVIANLQQITHLAKEHRSVGGGGRRAASSSDASPSTKTTTC